MYNIEEIINDTKEMFLCIEAVHGKKETAELIAEFEMSMFGCRLFVMTDTKTESVVCKDIETYKEQLLANEDMLNCLIIAVNSVLLVHLISEGQYNSDRKLKNYYYMPMLDGFYGSATKIINDANYVENKCTVDTKEFYECLKYNYSFLKGMDEQLDTPETNIEDSVEEESVEEESVEEESVEEESVEEPVEEDPVEEPVEEDPVEEDTMEVIPEYENPKFAPTIETLIKNFLPVFADYYKIVFEKNVQGVMALVAKDTAQVLKAVNKGGKISIERHNPAYQTEFYAPYNDSLSTYDTIISLLYLALQKFYKTFDFLYGTDGGFKPFSRTPNAKNIEEEYIKNPHKSKNAVAYNYLPGLHAMCTQRLIYAYAVKEIEGGIKYIPLKEVNLKDKTMRVVPCMEEEARKRKGGVYVATTIKQLQDFAEAYLRHYLAEILGRENIQGGCIINREIPAVITTKVALRLMATMYCCFMAVEVSESLIEVKVTYTPETFQKITKEMCPISQISLIDTSEKNLSFSKAFINILENSGKEEGNILNVEDESSKYAEYIWFTKCQGNFSQAYSPIYTKTSMLFAITQDAAMYRGKPEFAWRRYGEFYSINKPGLNNFLVGKNLQGEAVSLNISSPQAVRGFTIYAGSRAGKGVQTLSLLAPFLGMGSPLIYIDDKPDMLLMLKDTQNKWRQLANDTEFKFLSCDGSQSDNTLGDFEIQPYELSFDGKKDKTRLQLQNSTYIVLRALKLLYFFGCFEIFRATASSKGIQIDMTPALCVVDELANFTGDYNKAKKDIIEVHDTIVSYYVQAKKDKNIELQGKLQKGIAYLRYLLNTYFCSIQGDWGKAYVNCTTKEEGSAIYGVYKKLNTDTLGRTLSKFLIISQFVPSYTNETQYSKQYPCFLAPIAFATGMLLGANATPYEGGRAYYKVTPTNPNMSKFVAAQEENNKDTKKESVKIVENKKEITGYFGLKTNGVENPNSLLRASVGENINWTVIKPYLTLNENDYNPTACGKFTDGCMKVIENAGINVESIIHTELLRADGKTLENRVGFAGLCEYMFAVLNGTKAGMSIAEIEKKYISDENYRINNVKELLKTMKKGLQSYKTFMDSAFKNETEDVPYKCVEEYLNDFTSKSCYVYDISLDGYRFAITDNTELNEEEVNTEVQATYFSGVNQDTEEGELGELEEKEESTGDIEEVINVEEAEEMDAERTAEDIEVQRANAEYEEELRKQEEIAKSDITENVKEVQEPKSVKEENKAPTSIICNQQEYANENTQVISEDTTKEKGIDSHTKTIEAQAAYIKKLEENQKLMMENQKLLQAQIQQLIEQQNKINASVITKSVNKEEDTFNDVLVKDIESINQEIKVDADICEDFKQESPESNYKLAVNLTKKIFLPTLKKYFGTLSQITSIRILNNKTMLINGISFRPVLKDVDLLKTLPLVYQMNLVKGNWAGMIDLSIICLCFPKLAKLIVDNEDFAEDVLKGQLKLQRNDSWGKLFHCKELSNLRLIVIGEDKYTAQDEEQALKERMTQKQESRKKNSIFNRLKTLQGIANIDDESPMVKLWKHPAMEGVKTAGKWTLGTKAVITASTAIGGVWGLMFGAVALGSWGLLAKKKLESEGYNLSNALPLKNVGNHKEPKIEEKMEEKSKGKSNKKRTPKKAAKVEEIEEDEDIQM